MYTRKELGIELRSNGCKVTPQRIAVYEFLASTKAHPTVEIIYQKLHSVYPNMSLATVYKTVDALQKMGIIQELNTGEEAFRYDAETVPHAHIQCTVCGRVDDVPDLAAAGLQQEVAESTGYEVASQQLYFYGVCPHCKKSH